MLKDLFSKRNKKYVTLPTHETKGIPEGIMKKCPKCKKIMYKRELEKNMSVCLNCAYHHPMTANERIASLVDDGSFVEIETNIFTKNPLGFAGYEKKIAEDQNKTGLSEAVVVGKATLSEIPFVIAVMDSHFRMGSMGSVVGEKITKAIEWAMHEQVPFILFTASGGARMQEGALSLMQMAKTSAALQKFSSQGGLIISIMTHPTTGGVSASIASLGDYNFAEPQALIGFAGRRVIEQTVRERLPADFQTAEFLLKCGQLDAVIHRHQLKETLTNLLDIHKGGLNEWELG